MKAIKEKVEVEKIVCYRAVDGSQFTTEEECKKYEESAECVIKAAFKNHLIKETNPVVLMDEGYEDNYIYIVDVADADALREINMYISMIMQNTWRKDVDEQCLLKDNSIGKTILLCTNYEQDWWWSRGTIDEYIESIRSNYEFILNPPKKEGDDA